MGAAGKQSKNPMVKEHLWIAALQTSPVSLCAVLLRQLLNHEHQISLKEFQLLQGVEIVNGRLV